MNRNDLLTIAQRLREYVRNPHHVNPMSEAFRGLIDEAIEALSTSAEPKCCVVTPEEQAMLVNGDYTPEELWGIGGKPSCPKCFKSKGASERDERAEFEAFFTEKAKTLPLLKGATTLRYAGGQYVNDWALFGMIVWNARAALERKP